MRKQIIAGNWKMNTNLPDACQLVSEIIYMVQDEVQHNPQIVVIPPYPFIAAVQHLIPEKSRVKVGAQNCHEEKNGAFTGEVAAGMLASLEVKYVVLGHSERRAQLGENDELIARKTNRVLENNMQPIFCCGEPLDVREAGNQESYTLGQVTNSLFHLEADAIKQVVIAYEPVWAIGTGKTATAEQAREMHKAIRNHLANQYGAEVAEEVSILYGGSMKPGNAAELLQQPDVDGGLIGGASLKSRDFVDIIKALPH